MITVSLINSLQDAHLLPRELLHVKCGLLTQIMDICPVHFAFY